MRNQSKESYIIPMQDTAFLFFPLDMEKKEEPAGIEALSQYVKEHLADRMGVQGEVSIRKIQKNNMDKTGVCFKAHGSNMAPTVYLDEYKDMDKDKALDEIAAILKEYTVYGKADFSEIYSIENVKHQICYKVVGAERNEQRLSDCPHRIVKDLAITYHVALRVDGMPASIEIKNDLMNVWHVSENDLYELAMKNTQELRPAKICSMSQFLKEKAGDDVPEEFLGGFFDEGFYVATNINEAFGAGVMFYPGMLKEMEMRMGGDYYIIPSSVHEVIFVTDRLGMGLEMIKEMVTEVNMTQVLPEEVLTDNVYRVVNGEII